MSATLEWLGQAGFIVRVGDDAVAIDPFLSDYPGRLYRAPRSPEELAGVDLVVVTHEHADHFDAPSLLRLLAVDPTARIVLADPLLDRAVALGFPLESLVGVQPGDHMNAGSIGIDVVPALHGVHVTDAYTFGLPTDGAASRYVGYVLRTPGGTVYHSGDTLTFAGQAARLRELGVDVALLPINGRDPQREAQDIVGNLTPEEAVRLARAARIATIVPMHYECMANNLGDLESFLALCREEPEPRPAVLDLAQAVEIASLVAPTAAPTAIVEGFAS